MNQPIALRSEGMKRRLTLSRCAAAETRTAIRNHAPGFPLVLSLAMLSVSAPAQSPNFQWAARAGGGNDADSGNGVAVSSAGTSYATGFIRSTNADFGSVTLTNAGISDIYVAKYDPAGNV